MVFCPFAILEMTYCTEVAASGPFFNCTLCLNQTLPCVVLGVTVANWFVILIKTVMLTLNMAMAMISLVMRHLVSLVGKVPVYHAGGAGVTMTVKC